MLTEEKSDQVSGKAKPRQLLLKKTDLDKDEVPRTNGSREWVSVKESINILKVFRRLNILTLKKKT